MPLKVPLIMCAQCGGVRTGKHMCYCKDCMAARARAYYATHRQQCIERSITTTRASRKQDPERHRRYARDGKRRQLSDPVEYAKHLARGRQWVQDNPDKAKQFKHAQPAYRAARTQTRRARESGAAGRYTGADVSKILSAQNHRCFYCGTDITKHPQVDHVMPLARGGSNWPSNLVGACADCNARKGMMLPEDFIQQHKEA